MTDPKSPEDLLRSAREAARNVNVREAVRELTLHALRSRLLTADHIATVARTVGKGIESSDLPPAVPARESTRGAWTGLEEAVEEALLALELAAREFSEGRARLPEPERARMLREIEALELSLGAQWREARDVPQPLKSRISSVTAHLRRAMIAEVQAPSEASRSAVEVVAGDGRVLSLVASGVLLGLTQPSREPSKTSRG